MLLAFDPNCRRLQFEVWKWLCRQNLLGYTPEVEKVVQAFRSFEEADAADAAYYRSLTPQERLDILLELVRRSGSIDEAECRLERVCRIVELAQS